MSNYRPISILPTISKIFEKLLHKRIYEFFEKNNIIYDYQFGFRKEHSTIHAIQTDLSSVITSLNSSYQTMGILVTFHYCEIHYCEFHYCEFHYCEKYVRL